MIVDKSKSNSASPNGGIPAKPRRRPARQAVLEAAGRVLRNCSFEEFSLEDVARLAGLTRRTIYNQFLGKADVYRSSRELLLAGIRGSIPSRIDPEQPLREGLLCFAKTFDTLLRGDDHSDLQRSILRDSTLQPWLATAYRREIVDTAVRAVELFLHSKRADGEFTTAAETGAARFVALLLGAAGPVPQLWASLLPATDAGTGVLPVVVEAFLLLDQRGASHRLEPACEAVRDHSSAV